MESSAKALLVYLLASLINRILVINPFSTSLSTIISDCLGKPGQVAQVITRHARQALWAETTAFHETRRPSLSVMRNAKP